MQLQIINIPAKIIEPYIRRFGEWLERLSYGDYYKIEDKKE